MKPQTSSRRIDDPGLITACHCGAEYEIEYSAMIEIHTPTSINSPKSIDNHLEESIDSSPNYWENDYYNPTLAEERATEYRGIRAEEDKLLHHSYGIRNATSIDRTIPTSIDTYHYQTNHKRASTDISYYKSIDIGVGRAQEGNYSIGSWADDHYHENYAVETSIRELGADKLHEGFTTEELLNHKEHSDTDSLFAEACGRGTCFYRPFTRAKCPSIDNKASISIDKSSKTTIRCKDPEGYARAIDGHALQVSREDIADILQMANGAENLFMQQHNIPEHQQRVTNELYDTTGGVDDRFKPKYQKHTRPSNDIGVQTSIDRRPDFGKRTYDRDGTRRFHWEERMCMGST
ncbi:hypothetical protein F2Q70_00027773 [Brassica cretica]|uniref:Uncharacterized protein n=1 Tax=Brassica cretica TaxID=69181 RepID=A0A8S9LEE5_BRACR|nr:hypothetical protein F2Q70_00027773 [Brassica cretica]